ncbi:MAG TPA: hypothetical protein VLB29_10560 [Nocardioidaceae bacterium]|nr:hypothetical protein [Nocardioidaceae bacterium]
MTNRSRTPDFMPTLSPGRHRNPRKGACFMEMASFLAGERWSDHPNCTHPLLAAMAREINDRLGDRARQDLVPLIPSVVGLVSDDPRVDVWIAREAALTALPVVSMTNQRAVAVGILRSEAVLNELDCLPASSLSSRARSSLDLVPEAEQWAREFISTALSRRDAFASRGAPAVVHLSVAGISRACVPEPEQMLVGLLRRTIEGVAQMTGKVVSHPSSRESASSTPVGEPANDALTNLPPSTVSKSMPDAVATPVSASKWDTLA